MISLRSRFELQRDQEPGAVEGRITVAALPLLALFGSDVRAPRSRFVRGKADIVRTASRSENESKWTSLNGYERTSPRGFHGKAGKQQATKSPIPMFKPLTPKLHLDISYVITFLQEIIMSLIARLVSVGALDSARSGLRWRSSSELKVSIDSHLI
jgi:hypothetical protein